MPSCAITNCTNRREHGFSLFTIRKNEAERQQWLSLCRLPPSTPSSACICEIHFTPDSFVMKEERIYLKPKAVPSIFGANLTSPFKSIQVSAYGLKQNTLSLKASATVKYVGTRPKIVNSNGRCVLQQIQLQGNVCSAIKDDKPDPRQESQDQQSVRAILEELRRKNAEFEKENRELKARVQLTQEAHNALLKTANSFLNPDQFKAMARDVSSSNTCRWTADTIRRCIRMRLVCRARGYEALRLEHKWPIPCLRTINRRLLNCNVLPGKYLNMVGWLAHKLRCERAPPAAWMCALSFDEMQTSELVEYDKGLKGYLGLVSKEIASSEKELTTKANHCLAFVVRGLTVHWKQFLTYLYTGKKVDSGKLWEFLQGLLAALRDNGFNVVTISSDMGGGNQALWSRLGLHWKRDKVDVAIPHPSPVQSESRSESRPELLFTPDVPHLVKNMWAQLLRTVFFMPKFWMDEHGVTSNIVSPDHVREYLNVQGTAGLVPVPGLDEAALNPTKFEKMRVPVALKFFSDKLGHAIIHASDIGLISRAAKTTGHFILTVAQWYQIMSGRDHFSGLSNGPAGEKRVEFLKKYIRLMENLKFWQIEKKYADNGFKPIQWGSIMAIKVVLRLWERYVQTGQIKYILCSRMFTSGVENIFSQARAGGDIMPRPVRLRHLLRLICVAQYLRCSSNASYEDDDEKYYVDFLDSVIQDKQQDLSFTEEEIDEMLSYKYEELQALAKQGLYYVAGWVVFKVKGNCVPCDDKMYSAVPLEYLPSGFTECVSRGGLSHPSYLSWSVISHCEDIVKANSSKILHMTNVKSKMLSVIKKKCQDLVPYFPACHDVVGMLADKFLSLRLHVLAANVSKADKDTSVKYGSCSAFQRTAAANCRGGAQAKLQKACAAVSGSIVPKPMLVVVPSVPPQVHLSDTVPGTPKLKTYTNKSLSMKRLIM